MILLKLIFSVASIGVGILLLGLCMAAGRKTPSVDFDREDYKQ